MYVPTGSFTAVPLLWFVPATRHCAEDGVSVALIHPVCGAATDFVPRSTTWWSTTVVLFVSVVPLS